MFCPLFKIFERKLVKQVAEMWGWIDCELKELAKFSESKEGITRLAFSREEAEARKYVEKMMQDIGMTTRIDAAGNLIGRIAGTEDALPAVAAGSHLDTVPNGGLFDGSLALLCTLAAVKEALKQGPFRHPLEVIVFSAEEPSRFGLAGIGSKAMSGQADPGNWQKLKDEKGISIKDACEKNGLVWGQIGDAARKCGELKAFLELSLEQGGVLEKVGMPLGVVEEVSAPVRFKIAVEGVAAHTGEAPVEERQDALLTAAMIILAIQDIGEEHSGEGVITTIGQLKVYPGAINVVPGRVEMWAEIYGRNAESVIECLQEIKDEISTIADGRETTAYIEMLSADRAVRLSAKLLELMEDVCREKGFACKRLENGLGKNSMHMSRISETLLLVMPVYGNIETQEIKAEEVEAAVCVLTAAINSLAV